MHKDFTIKTYDSLNSLLEDSKHYTNSYHNLAEKDNYRRIIRNEIHRLTKKAKILTEELAKAEKSRTLKIKADKFDDLSISVQRPRR